MTLGQLINELELRTGFADSRYRPRWVSFVNDAIREFARANPWPGLEDTIRLTGDGTKYLVFPHFVDDLVSLMSVTNSLPIDRGGDFDRIAPGAWSQGTAGAPIQYDKAGEVATISDPSGFVFFKSSHASDLSTVYITGIATNSGATGALTTTYKELAISAAGVSPVTLSTQFTKILSISKPTETNGDFYFYNAPNSQQLSYVAANESEARFRRIALLYVPANGHVFEARFRYRPPKLIHSSAAPHPSVKSDFIIQYAIGLHLQEQEQFSRQQVAEGKAKHVLEREAHKEENFNEPHGQFTPYTGREDDAVFYGDYQ